MERILLRAILYKQTNNMAIKLDYPDTCKL